MLNQIEQLAELDDIDFFMNDTELDDEMIEELAKDEVKDQVEVDDIIEEFQQAIKGIREAS